MPCEAELEPSDEASLLELLLSWSELDHDDGGTPQRQLFSHFFCIGFQFFSILFSGFNPFFMVSRGFSCLELYKRGQDELLRRPEPVKRNLLRARLSSRVCAAGAVSRNELK